MALQRHKDSGHIADTLKKAQEQDRAEHAIDIYKQLKAINSSALAILRESRDSGQNGLALQAIDRVQKQIELQAKLIGQLDERPQVNLLLAPEWAIVRQAIMDALQPYTTARADVAKALMHVESRLQ